MTDANAERERPLVSIIVPDHNTGDGDYVRETIESLANQTFLERGDLELIVINNGSKPEEEGILEEMKAQYGSYFTNFEVQTAVWSGKNRAVEYAKQYISPRSTYTFIADADDVLFPEYVATLLDHLSEQHQQNPSVVMTYADSILIDPEGMIVGLGTAPDFDRDIYFSDDPDVDSNFIPGNAILPTDVFKSSVPKDLESRSGDKQLRHRMELGDSGLAVLLPERLFFYRQHEDQVSGHWNQFKQDGHQVEGYLSFIPEDESMCDWRQFLKLHVDEQLEIIGRLPVADTPRYWRDRYGLPQDSTPS